MMKLSSARAAHRSLRESGTASGTALVPRSQGGLPLGWAQLSDNR